MKRANSFMATVVKKALGIDHDWGRVEFAPGRGAIHLHMILGAVFIKKYSNYRTNQKKVPRGFSQNRS
jgi:hypothetical protein